MRIKISKFIGIFLVLVLFGCQSTAPDNIRNDYPILDYQEIIGSQRGRNELFSESRSYLIDILSNANFISSGTTDGDMLSTRISNPIPFGMGATGYLEFNLVVEIKDKKMRFTTKNVQIITYNGYGQKFIDDQNKITTGNTSLRKTASKEYNDLIHDISKGLHDIANGKSSSEW
jgi:hypothetical protein